MLKKIDFSPKFFLLLFSALFVLSRLIFLESLPIFNDEAMYLNWGRLIVKDPIENFLISLTDGQQPFFIWLTALSYWLGGNNFLFAGRMISVFSGLGTMFLIYLIGKELFNQKTGLMAAFLYLVQPFTLWYDRLAIKDSFLMFLAGLTVYFTLRLAKTGVWKYAWGVGIALGIALLTKSIAYFFVVFFPLTFFLMYESKTRPGFVKTQFLQIFWGLIVAFLGQSLLYLSPLSSRIGQKNSVFLLSLSELWQLPMSLWRNNLYSTIIWWWQYYRLPLLIMGVFGFMMLIKKHRWRQLLVLSSWIFLPIVFEIFTAKIYIPRYFLFTYIAFGLLVAYGMKQCLSFFKAKLAKTLLVVLLILPSLSLDAKIIFSPEIAPLPQVERWQYFEGWPAGYGLKDVVFHLENEYLRKNKKITLITEEETLVSSGLPLYLTAYPDLKVEPVFSLEESLERQKDEFVKLGTNDLVILHHRQSVPDNWPIEEVVRIKRLTEDNFFLIVKPKTLPAN